jgi:hypothetical protein
MSLWQTADAAAREQHLVVGHSRDVELVDCALVVADELQGLHGSPRDATGGLDTRAATGAACSGIVNAL